MLALKGEAARTRKRKETAAEWRGRRKVLRAEMRGGTHAEEKGRERRPRLNAPRWNAGRRARGSEREKRRPSRWKAMLCAHEARMMRKETTAK